MYAIVQGAAPEKWMLEACEYTLFRFASICGFHYKGMVTSMANIPVRLQKAAEARNQELKSIVQYEGDNPPMSEAQLRSLMEKLPSGLYRDGVEYYGITHAHPNANSRYTTESLMHLMAFDVDDRMELIDQPLLMMAGDIADTKYMTDSAFQRAVNAKSRELFLIEGATHIRTYWVPEYVEKAATKLQEFLAANL